ncbi:hypothetical protein FC96_GL001344 [Secundilactobacillus kimchicus JCM 15530]|uniref:Phage protein n=2 Tax=Secundilactobacillus kimchicus TaxID=528209 RepID=A0A0R1HZX9_9LACO|nr:hypothetical protein FC96_GL001344 [Secundilactobacillus kimchicus JCM 15530]
MEMGIPDTGSAYAAEGTTAHSLVELKLRQATNQILDSEYETRMAKIKASDFYNQSMEDYTDAHVGLVMEDYNAIPDADIMLEERVDYSEWAPGGYGTSDTIIATTGRLEIWDLKYGKGVKVRANHNVQLMLYALGAIAEYNLAYEFETVKMTISQPRLGNVDSFEISYKDLMDWAETVVKPAADDALNGAGEWNFDDPSTWHFYKAAGFCRHLAETNLRIRQYEFKEANSLKPDEIADILSQTDRIRKWLDAVEFYATKQVLDGKMALPGYKVVAGRSNRKITDESAAEDVLRKAGYLKRDIVQTKLESITKLEKLTGKDKFAELLGSLIIKPEGKPTLVPDSDSRPAMGSIAEAQNDFK